jgi:hypothetical protein
LNLVEGQIYRLPNGEKVTARVVEDMFILEFKREYRTPLSVAVDGSLLLRGESTGLTVDSLAAVMSSQEPDTRTG